MNELYYSRELSKEEMDQLFKRLTIRWDISNHYWFPLYDTTAQSIIAFDSEAYEKEFGHKNLRIILREIIGLKEIIEIRELKYKGFVVKTETFEPSYEGIGEGYWFDSNMEWIIYCSHEGSITFGGEFLIKQIKDNWKSWERHIFC